MLSHRYGSRGLPTRIVDSEYKILLDELKNENTIDKVFEYTDDDGKSIKLENILETCYEFDSNEIPARYRLKYLDRLFPTMDQKVEKLCGLVACRPRNLDPTGLRNLLLSLIFNTFIWSQMIY